VKTERSVILETGVNAVFTTVLLFALFLLFSGHNQPGGGFVGGLVAGAAFVLRFVAGGADAVRSSTRISPPALLGIGLLVAAGTGLVSLAAGQAFLESALVERSVPVLGTVKASSTLPFDIGVFLVVVGLVLTVLDTLGATQSGTLAGEPGEGLTEQGPAPGATREDWS
jgi:multisubunit Na+/H+ antiporter MnhB subunit